VTGDLVRRSGTSGPVTGPDWNSEHRAGDATVGGVTVAAACAALFRPPASCVVSVMGAPGPCAAGRVAQRLRNTKKRIPHEIEGLIEGDGNQMVALGHHA